MLQFAQMPMEQAVELTFVLPVRAGGVSPRLSIDREAYDALRDQVLRHIESLNAIDLASPMVRDVYVKTLVRSMLEEAQAAGVGQLDGSPAWTTTLGDVCMVMLADEAALREYGVERLTEMAHEDAVRAARDAGEPHDARALALYDARAMAGHEQF